MNYILGIDNGGTVVKVAIFDFKGNQIQVSKRNLETILSKPGHVERNLEDLFNRNIECISEVISKSGIGPEKIKAISLSGHGKGLYLLDKKKNEYTNAILSSDTRSLSIVREWNELGINRQVYKITKQNMVASHPLPLLEWLKRNENNVFEKVGYILSVNDYIRFKLTDSLMTEKTMASGNNFINISSMSYDKRIFEIVGLSELYTKLSEVSDSCDITGEITSEISKKTGLIKGTPVIAGLFDIDASGIAMGLRKERQLCIIGGTWSINQFLTNKNLKVDSTTKQSLYCIDGLRLVEESSATSASNLQWFIDKILDVVSNEPSNKDIYAKLNSWVSDVGDDDSLIFIPQLYGTLEEIDMSASFHGLKAHHDIKHIVKSIYEGIVFAHYYHCEKLEKNVNDGFKEILLAGGVVNSSQWVQMFADCFQKPVSIVENKELGSLGACMAGYVAIGLYKDLQEASENLNTSYIVVKPNKEKKNYYENKYKSFKRILNKNI